VHSAFGKIKLWWFETQQLILGTGTAIWWLTEPHYDTFFNRMKDLDID
jgi:hypothetical protein